VKRPDGVVLLQNQSDHQRLEMKHARPRYVGRAAAASPATGVLSKHQAQQKALIDEALG